MAKTILTTFSEQKLWKQKFVLASALQSILMAQNFFMPSILQVLHESQAIHR